MGFHFHFSFGRSDGYPTRYPNQESSPAHIDVLIAGLITAFLIVGIGFLAIIPAYNSLMRKVLFCRVTCSLFIGGVILGGNYGHNWEIGEFKISTPYKPGLPDEIQGHLGLHIALRGINVTLKGKPFVHANNDTKNKNQHAPASELSKEIIDYNEHFSWEWAQGRFGFGKYAGRISRDFRAAILRGIPIPILQVAEYFTFDGEGIRFGRHYRLAGWYSHLILWFAFGTWLIANILFCMVIRTAALFLFFTGCLQIAAVGVWTFVRNPIELQIPFQSYKGDKDIIFETHFGLDYYLVFANGIFCIVLSGVVTLLDSLMPDEMCQVFGIDPLTIYDELLLSKEEVTNENKRLSILKPKMDDIEMQPSGISPHPSGSEQSSEQNEDLSLSGELYLRRRLNPAGNFVRQSFRQIKPRIPRRSKGSDESQSQLTAAEAAVRRPLLQRKLSTSDDEDIGTNDSQHESWPPPPTPIRTELMAAPTLSRKGPPPPIPLKRN